MPWMLMTGTKDTSLIGDADVESRLAVFPVLPAGGKDEVVLHNAEHSAFSQRFVVISSLLKIGSAPRAASRGRT